MLPITRANLQSFCRSCLREFTVKETKHDVNNTFLKNSRLFPQKLCHGCYIKIKTLKNFQDRANIATAVLRLIIAERYGDCHYNDKKSEYDSTEGRIKTFCRLCLKSNFIFSSNVSERIISNYMKECLGLVVERMETQACEKDSTNQLVNDERYPYSVCLRCQTTLTGFIEYRLVSKQTSQYLQSILGDFDSNSVSEDRIQAEPKRKKLINATELCLDFEAESTLSVDLKNQDLTSRRKHFLKTANEHRKIKFYEQCCLIESNKTVEHLDHIDKRRKFEGSQKLEDHKLESNKSFSKNRVKEFDFDILNITKTAFSGTSIISVEGFNENKIDNELKEKTSSKADLTFVSSEARFETNADSKNMCLANLTTHTKQKNLNIAKTQAKNTIKHFSSSKNSSPQCKCYKRFDKIHTIKAHAIYHEERSKTCACEKCKNTMYQAQKKHTSKQHGYGSVQLKFDVRHKHNSRIYRRRNECPMCHIAFNQHFDFAEHIRNVHKGRLIFTCKICAKRLSSQSALNRHVINHSDEKPFVCQFCEKRYNNKTELKVHMQRHIADPSTLCPICKVTRANADELQKHITNHKKSHQCFKCGKVFTKAYNLHQHELSVHQKLFVHKCKDCDMNFKTRKTLVLHRLHHDPTGRPEVCRACNLYFKTKRGRLRHTRKFHAETKVLLEESSPTISAGDGRTVCCEKCSLKFLTKRGLLLHTKKTHLKGQRASKTEAELNEKYGGRSQICEVCELQCFSKRGLARHVRKSHPKWAELKDEDKFASWKESCGFCPLKFRTARGLLLHTKRMHRG